MLACPSYRTAAPHRHWRRLVCCLLALGIFVGRSFAAATPPPTAAPRALAPWLGDVSAAAEGALAVPVDPAAAGVVDGAELSLRRAPAAGTGGLGALGLYGALPLGPVAVHGGVSFWRIPRPLARAGQLGLSVRILPSLRLGGTWQRLQAPATDTSRSVYDLGLLWRPSNVISVSGGGEALNAPNWRQGHWTVHRALRLGVALRPLRGSAALTLAADARIAQRAGPVVADSRALLDVAPWGEGLHLLAGWRHTPPGHAVWFGLRLETFGVGLMGAGRAYAPAPSRRLSADDFAVVARWQQAANERLFGPRPSTCVELDVTGSLRPSARGIFGRRAAVATLPLQLRQLAGVAEVTHVLLNVDTFTGGLATADELREGILALRAAGKRVEARLQQADTLAYLVATAADAIVLDPMGSLDLRGFAWRRHYFAEALARLGVRFEAVGIGRFKSAPDTWTEAGPRPQEAGQAAHRLQQAYATLTEAICRGRHLSHAAAEAALAYGLYDATTALRTGLVDAVAPAVTPATGETTPLVHGAAPPPARQPRPTWAAPAKIAVVPIVGVMQVGSGPGLLPGQPACDADAVVSALQRAQRDPQVAAILLRIDSPGGDVAAAESIWRAVHQAARHRPLVASLGDVAASGGYYAAVAAPTIFAEPSSVTGSIGIFRLKPDFHGALDKLGIHAAEDAAGPNAAWDDVLRPWSEDDRVRLRRHLRGYYDAFVARVAAGRHLTTARAESLAEGRIYSGADALAAGLVDQQGGMAAALAHLRQMANLPDADDVIVDVPEESLALGQRLGLWGLAQGAAAKAAFAPLAALEGLEAQLQRLSATTLALWPGEALLR